MMTIFTSLFIFFFTFASLCASNRVDRHGPSIRSEKQKRCNLKELGEEYQVDKVNIFHNYQILYCELLKPIRHNHIKLLEIGFGCGHHVHGQSCLMWNAFFSHLTYYAVDFMDENSKERVTSCVDNFQKENAGKLEKIWLGDQSKPSFLASIIREYGVNNTFDVIIDDGGHRYEQQLESFKALWPAVTDGGLYIVEDMAMDHTFSKLVSMWMQKIGSGSQTGRKSLDILEGIPTGVSIMGCSFQICYFRKVLPSQDELPKIWGENYDVDMTSSSNTTQSLI